MKVRVVAKSICVEESTRMYAWVVQMMHEMEPCFFLSHICLIFGDQGTTQSLLETLGGVKQSCLLRGDFHHLIDELFPDQFGIHKFTIIVAWVGILGGVAWVMGILGIAWVGILGGIAWIGRGGIAGVAIVLGVAIL
jgi:hypothetical protein